MAGTIVDAVAVLVAAVSIERVAVGSVCQRGTLISNRFVQHVSHRGMQPFPLAAMKLLAFSLRVNAGHVQDLRCVEVAHARQGTLIE